MNARIEMLDEPEVLGQPKADGADAPQQPLALAGSDSRALMQMIGAAMTRADFDIVKLERLLAVKKEWEADEARKAYNAAFAAFKDEAVRIIKNRSVTDGPLKGKRYAELFAVVNAVTPALSLHGLSASWKITKDEKDWIEVTCTLKHAAGHSESVSMGGPPDAGGAKNAIMARASTVSYLERYTLKAITGLSEQDDDNDGGHGGDQRPMSEYPAAEFDKNLPVWREAIMAGKTTAAAVIAKVQTKAPLTKHQQARIHGQ